MVYFMELHELYFVTSNAPVAQLDRVLVSETKGREFESRRAHHISLKKALSGLFMYGLMQKILFSCLPFLLYQFIHHIYQFFECACGGG